MNEKKKYAGQIRARVLAAAFRKKQKENSENTKADFRVGHDQIREKADGLNRKSDEKNLRLKQILEE